MMSYADSSWALRCPLCNYMTTQREPLHSERQYSHQRDRVRLCTDTNTHTSTNYTVHNNGAFVLNECMNACTLTILCMIRAFLMYICIYILCICVYLYVYLFCICSLTVIWLFMCLLAHTRALVWVCGDGHNDDDNGLMT